MWKEGQWDSFRCYPGIFLESLRKTMKLFGSYSPNLDAGPHEHETNSIVRLELTISLLTVSRLQCKEEIIYCFLGKQQNK